MKSLFILVLSGLVGLGTFGLIAKKFGSDCIP
jgi:hypothetical protein